MNKQRASQAVPSYVLFYHRVANDHLNPWSISCRDFQNQVEWIKKNFDIIDLQECQRRAAGGNNRPAVAITFDDVYAENCDFALPFLLEQSIPVTYFVTTEHTINQKPFQMPKEEGLLGACTTIGRWNDVGSESFRSAWRSMFRTHLKLA